ncbi:hypothetical protein [Chondromyces crocatus]|uniref:Uncharacterized protein n=1 Tax=Chondromyces crocatus TaxID=52 RepID=A0A0K1EFU4_CHOCO|nr:hypothetical protein [Chondromyces crocatus]AKT39741.1 uncharacterized protein CMC5_038900 [Chondromyces crocatus]
MSSDDVHSSPPRARHPGVCRRPGVVAVYFAYRTLAAWILAGPLALLVGGLLGHFPGNDAALFEPGALVLSEVARLSTIAVAPLSFQLGTGAVLAAALGLLPLAVLIVALAHEGALHATFLAARVGRALGPLVLLWGIASVTQLVVAGFLLVAGGKLLVPLGLTEQAAGIAHAVLLGLALLVAAFIGAIHDLGRVVLLLDTSSLLDAIERSFRLLRAAPLTIVQPWLSRVGAGAVLLGLSFWLVPYLGLATPMSIGVSFVIHHGVLLVTVLLRASWLAAAIPRISPPDFRGTPENAFSPVDPP